MNKFAKRAINYNYLSESNPYTTIESLSELVNKNLALTNDKNFCVLNKPPGFVTLDTKKQDTNGLVDVLIENIKQMFNWEKAIRVPLVTNNQSGICLFTNSTENFDNTRKTMHSTFATTHVNFLKFYGITTYIPIKSKGKEVFNVSYKTIDDEVLYYEEKQASKSQHKLGKIITYQIEHETLSYNEKLNVALVKFDTMMHNGDGINIYCLKNLCPLLGDDKYSSGIKKIFDKPVLAPNIKDLKPAKQELSKRVLDRLGLTKNDVIPLHLHLCELNLRKKFNKQKIIIKHQVPLFDYFTETLKRLELKLPE